MKSLFLGAFLLFCGIVCQAEAPGRQTPERLDIRTLSGEFYRDAKVENIRPDGIDISFVDSSGHTILRGILFSDLSDELKEKFHYDAAAESAFLRRRKEAEKARAERASSDAEKIRVEEITRNIRRTLLDGKGVIPYEDLTFAANAARRRLKLLGEAQTKEGTIARVADVVDGGEKTPERIHLSGIKLPLGETREMTVYPSGVKIRYLSDDGLLIFCNSPEAAATVAADYLEYCRKFIPPEKSAAAAPKSVSANSSSKVSAQDLGIVDKTGNRDLGSYYFNDGYYADNTFYGFPFWYYPQFPRPCPPRPRPPRPPQPPRPVPPQPSPPFRPGTYFPPR